MVYGRKPNLSHLRVFGCETWVNVPKQLRRKGQEKARKHTFMGYEACANSYHFMDGRRNVIISRVASFLVHRNWSKLHGVTCLVFS